MSSLYDLYASRLRGVMDGSLSPNGPSVGYYLGEVLEHTIKRVDKLWEEYSDRAVQADRPSDPKSDVPNGFTVPATARDRIIIAAVEYVKSYSGSTAEDVLMHGDPRAVELWDAVLSCEGMSEADHEAEDQDQQAAAEAAREPAQEPREATEVWPDIDKVIVTLSKGAREFLKAFS